MSYNDDEIIIYDDDNETTVNNDEEVINLDEEEPVANTTNTAETESTVSDTVNPCNTIIPGLTEFKKKARRFHIVVHQKLFGVLKKILKNLKHITNRQGKEKLNYLLACEHIGDKKEGLHVHIFAQYNDTVTISNTDIYHAHFEECKRSAQANITYIKCDDKGHHEDGITSKLIYEYGEPRFTGNGYTANKVKKMSYKQIDEEVPLHLTRLAKEIKKEQHEIDILDNVLNEIRKDQLQAPEIYYITGKSGLGKTYGAFKECCKLESNNENIGTLQINNNFCKFTRPEAENIVIPEFRPSQMAAAEFLQLIDKYGYNANVKGGFQMIRPKRIYICSIKPVFEIYKDEVNQQFIRRVTKFYTAVDEGHKVHRLIDSTDFVHKVAEKNAELKSSAF